MKDISLHVMDIVQNSITAGASKITVSIKAEVEKDLLIVKIIDNGSGMDESMVAKVTDPFVTSRVTRKVGLGIPLLKFSAESAGGSLILSSKKGKGTVVEACYKINHVDRIPLGSISETIASLIAANPEIAFRLKLYGKRQEFRLDSESIRKRLGNVPINNPEVTLWIKDYIEEGIKLIFGGVLNEVIG
ncbi:MAG: histidine kinase [Clostridiales bacterium]|jgi:DNA mismatch repair ATPase MutL|nr:histidine kinase [Clostridiales bacterium]